MSNHITLASEVKQDSVGESCAQKEIYVWVGDNLGSCEHVIVDVISDSGEVSLNLEEALRKIDQFVEYGRNRILSALSFHFDLEAI